MFILRRFLAFIPVALIVALIVFLMLHLSPGDPVAAIAGDSATAADIARIRAELGLDDPPFSLPFRSALGRLTAKAAGLTVP